jgi:hypothetical protein
MGGRAALEVARSDVSALDIDAWAKSMNQLCADSAALDEKAMYRAIEVHSEQTADKVRVGQSVRIKHGFRGVIGEVVEDHGPIGVHGRLYSVKLRLDPWNELTSELPEESVETVQDK